MKCYFCQQTFSGEDMVYLSGNKRIKPMDTRLKMQDILQKTAVCKECYDKKK